VIREQSYEVPIPGTDWTLVGRADGVIYDAFTGTVDVVEDKLRATKQNVTWIDQQLRFSAWALAQEGTPVRAFRYRQVVKPPRSMRQRKDENWKDWLDRLEREAADPKRMHETLVMPEGKPADTERELRAWVLATEHRLSVGVHPRNTSRCDDFGGCTYRDLCHEQPGAEHAFTTPDQRALEDAP
jgi:hypothetical protein